MGVGGSHDCISRDGYVVAQECLPEAEHGDIRVFVMNGEPLVHDGLVAAFRRVKTATARTAKAGTKRANGSA